LRVSTHRRFARTGVPLALDPQAFGLEISDIEVTEPFQLVANGAVAVVDVRGPLTHDGMAFDSYAAVLGRVRAALSSKARSVVMRIDSPGGDVFGAFDTADALRASAKAAGKRLIAFSEARMQSAAYALACAADEIVITSVANVGSIGVIVAHVDTTGADAAMGLRFEVFSSGERKADGNPHVKLTSTAQAAIQRSIDDTAAVFFDLVRERRGLNARAFGGRVWVGVAAWEDGIVDRVESWDALIARLGSAKAAPIAAPKPAKPASTMQKPATASAPKITRAPSAQRETPIMSAKKTQAELEREAIADLTRTHGPEAARKFREAMDRTRAQAKVAAGTPTQAEAIASLPRPIAEAMGLIPKDTGYHNTPGGAVHYPTEPSA
jgi:capsid assembly protease